MSTTTLNVKYAGNLSAPGLTNSGMRRVVNSVLTHCYSRYADLAFNILADDSGTSPDILIRTGPTPGWRGMTVSSAIGSGDVTMSNGTNSDGTTWSPWGDGYDGFAKIMAHELGHILIYHDYHNPDVTSVMNRFDGTYGANTFIGSSPFCNLTDEDVAALRVNFGTQPSPVSWISANQDNAGFTSTPTRYSGDRGQEKGGQLKRDFVCSTDMTFEVTGLDSGTYSVATLMGDADYAHDSVEFSIVDANGSPVLDTVGRQKKVTLWTGRNQWIWWLFTEISVSDGKIRVRVKDTGGGDLLGVLCALDVIGQASKKWDFGVNNTTLSDSPIVLKQATEGIVHCVGTTVPTNGTAGFATGCLFSHSDGTTNTALYVNKGNATSCTFSAVSFV